jgi:hypothetical protein
MLYYAAALLDSSFVPVEWDSTPPSGALSLERYELLINTHWIRVGTGHRNGGAKSRCALEESPERKRYQQELKTAISCHAAYCGLKDLKRARFNRMPIKKNDGGEAVPVGVASATHADDVLFVSYRESGALFVAPCDVAGH